MNIQNVGFLAKSLALTSPKPADLAGAYRALSGTGTLTFTCLPPELPELLFAAESAGFFGITIAAKEPLTITAQKGKEGPCHDTGRVAEYLGAASAAMDDDHHLLSGRVRICEKTSRLFASPAYGDRIRVSEGDPALLARLEKDPAPFDCDTFESDARALAQSFAARSEGRGPDPSPERIPLIYPGPFKLLILADGSLVRRGQLVRVPLDQARELERRDAAILRPAGMNGEAKDPEAYPVLFQTRGAAALLDELPPDLPPRPPRPAVLGALDELPDSMKRKLLTLISRGEEHFILTGSDPAQKDGCCPSNEVGLANRMADAGILDSLGAAPNADCPVTLYAFAGELRREHGKPAFVRHESLRRAVRERLEKGPAFSRKVLVRLALLAVLAAAIVTLSVSLLRQARGH